MIYGSGEYSYELVEGWIKIPEGISVPDIGSISIDDRDTLYILNRGDQPVLVFDRDGNFIKSWGEGYFTKRVHGSCIGPDGSIYCTDDGNHTVTKFDTDGNVLMTLGVKDRPSDTGYRWMPNFWEGLASIERGGPPFNRPTGVAVSSKGEIFVADGYGNARIHKFSPDGKLLFSLGEPGGEPCQFRLPHSICVDKQDRVWVPDRENHRIQIFNDDGEFLTQWRNTCHPTDIRIDKNDIVYVSELCNRVSIYTIDGKLLARWSNEGHDVNDLLFTAPHTMAADSKGDIYVGEVARTHAKVDRGSRVIQKFAKIH